jgi:sulfonate transport system permease protein
MEIVVRLAKKYKNKFFFTRQIKWNSVILPFALLVIWQVIILLGLVKPILLPSPQQVMKVAMEMIVSGELIRHLSVSLIRVLEGFSLAAILAVSLGVVLGMSAVVFQLANGTIQLLRPIPPIAWLPLAILWFGIEEGSKVFIIIVGAFFPIFTNVLDGIRQTESKYVELVKVLEISRWRIITKVVIPGALPFIFAGLRTGLGYAWMCVVAAELSAGMTGIGYMLTDARAMIQTDRVLVGMLAIGAIGKLMDMMLQLIEKKVIKGKEFYTGK